MDFETRYKKLNDAQKTAVDTIDGPLMIVAGPGTGKTELLGMRAANILKKTDTLPQNILCLTFTESGADAMRRRLTEIIGADAYKVTIHTFHSFGIEIMNRYGEYFYNGARFEPATDLTIYEVLHGIFDELEYSSPIASVMNGEYTYLRDTISTISELKRSGLTNDELLKVLDDNERVLDASEKQMQEIFSDRISKTTKDKLAPLIEQISELTQQDLPPGITSLSHTLHLSLSHAIEAAESDNSTKPITAWRNAWFEKNDQNEFVFKDRKRTAKLRAVAFVYYKYLKTMEEQELYDFDDMVLLLVHALEVIDELRFNLQEQYLYIMVDEFQDTNLAQARILASLTNNPVTEGAPNIMVVGDDDQAIYSFQGAEISNILQFKDLYRETRLVTLTDNYRSSEPILEHARTVITRGQARLENYIPQLNKVLTAHQKPSDTFVKLHEHSVASSERAWLANEIRNLLDSGVNAQDITVIARRHHELVSLLPYFAHAGIPVNYERRENVLDNEVVSQLELLARIVSHLSASEHDEADALLPELLAHSAWNITPVDLWRLSLDASRSRKGWLEQMSGNPTFQAIHEWLIEQAKVSRITPLEQQLDALIGTPKAEGQSGFVSPLYSYFFSSGEENAEQYLILLDALRTIRDKMREYHTDSAPRLNDFLDFIDLQRKLGTSLVSVRSRSRDSVDHINLMTAHKSKGLEFDHVFIIGTVDSAWGERVRTKSRLITYPANLPIAAAGDSYDERLRLFFVAMTRAKKTLTLSYSLMSDTMSRLAKASFLFDGPWQEIVHKVAGSQESLLKEATLAWYQPITHVDKPSMQDLLAPVLETYRLSATHFNAFLDVTRGGPQHFLLHNLLRFPEAMSPNAAYGSAFHKTLQQAHAHFAATKKQRPVEDVLKDFETNLEATYLTRKDHDTYLKRGLDYLQVFLSQKYASFNALQKPELDFSRQSSVLGEARLTGSLDLVEIDEKAKTMQVTDYKTGKPSTSWRGKSDYEKIKLHKYRQQLMFYKLLVEHSRDYSAYSVNEASIQFVEPTASGAIVAIPLEFDNAELERFDELIRTVWQKIMNLDFPDVTALSQDYDGLLEFEDSLLG